MSTREELEQTNLSGFKITFLFFQETKTCFEKKKTKRKRQKTKTTYGNNAENKKHNDMITQENETGKNLRMI